MRRNRYRNRRKGADSSKKYKNMFQSTGITKKILEIAEDILRTLIEQKNHMFPKNNLNEICLFPKKLGRALSILEAKEFIRFQDNYIVLTKNGEEIAKKIYKKHIAIENAFISIPNSLSVHKIANILEHILSDEEIEKIYSIANINEIKSYPLSEYFLPRGTVHKITIESERYFYRLLSLGIYPGQVIEIDNKNQINQIIKVKNSRFAIDKTLAKYIYVFP
ncbi:MAG: FeoA domain-containing protein [Promethearchaeota archaeon]